MEAEANHLEAGKKLAVPQFGGGLIRLRDVIALHEKYDGGEILRENIGDGFLCATNPVFRNIRSEFRRRGFSYSLEDRRGYFTFPLMSLDGVIADKTAPYRDNFSWLTKLEARAPGQFGLEDLRKFELHYNYLFHESAHCVAHSIVHEGHEPAFFEKNADTLLGNLIGEAFANTVEALCSVFVVGDIGAYFITANTHFALDMPGVAVVLRAARANGFAATIRILLYGFLYANFLYRELAGPELSQISQLAGIPSDADGLPELTRIALGLSETFRTETTMLYLIQQGYDA
ncbi:MAG: hypothetical protein HY074_08290 [Deltaproteobacteria bacterium]|nr:hypothetical protein [Deltaproteobacteria bacterium]